MSTEVISKILVIEDESSVREGLVDSLSFEGYSVVWRDNGKDGVSAYQEENPDLVILDVMMPGLDGLEVCKRIRQDGKYTPIIIIIKNNNDFFIFLYTIFINKLIF